MPYIDKIAVDRILKDKNGSDRQFLLGVGAYPASLKNHVDDIIRHIQNLPVDMKEGTANYCISRIVAGGLKPLGSDWRYMWLNRAYGTFMSAGAEFYRRLVAPYEQKCIEKNGDIPEYEKEYWL